MRCPRCREGGFGIVPSPAYMPNSDHYICQRCGMNFNTMQAYEAEKSAQMQQSVCMKNPFEGMEFQVSQAMPDSMFIVSGSKKCEPDKPSQKMREELCLATKPLVS